MTTPTSTWHGGPHPPSPTERAVPGTVVGGRYQLRAVIGHGGMGTVWQAADSLLRRDVAVKEVLLPPGIAAGDRKAMYERTMREARAAAGLSHPSVVQVYDVVTEGGRPWIVMELLHARSLADVILGDGPLAPRAVAKIGVALLGALEVAHSAGVLHRDVKPANVLICTDGRCVLTDFGVARMPAESNLTTPGMVLGSPHFISPERAVGGPFGPPSDLFSLGVSMFTAVEGRPPFDRGDPFETMRAVVEDQPIRPVRSGALAPVLYGLLEKDPGKRWDVPTARRALRELLSGPLANAQGQFITDPYAVLPTAPVPAPSLVEPPPTGQIGGRAMLAPGELPGDRHNRPMDPAGITPLGPPPGLPGAATPPFPGSPRVLPGTMPPPFGGAPAGFHGPLHPPQHAAPAGPVRKVLDRVRQLSTRSRMAVAGGLAAVLVLVTIVTVSASGGNGTPAARSSASTAPTAAAFAARPFKDDAHGYSLEVPVDWKQQAAGTYYDFTDPKDTGRRMRTNVEKAGNSAADFIRAVANEQSKHPEKCATPFNPIAQRTDVTLAGRPAAELEYTCGQGTAMRHYLWRATVLSGKAYEFYLSVPDSRFAESKVIYDHAAETYKLNKAP